MDLRIETALVETILFLEGDPLSIADLYKISGLEKDIVKKAVAELVKTYSDDRHGLRLAEIGDTFQFVPKEELFPHLKERYGKKNEKHLSKAALETLSIIAYSQPITRAEVDNIRGVASDNMIRLLIQKELVREVGKKDVPGKPTQYGTTKKFLHVFRLKSIADLPKLDDIEQERFELNG